MTDNFDFVLPSDMLDEITANTAEDVSRQVWTDIRTVKLGRSDKSTVGVPLSESKNKSEVYFTEIDDTGTGTCINTKTEWLRNLQVKIGHPPDDKDRWHVQDIVIQNELEPVTTQPGVPPHSEQQSLRNVGYDGSTVVGKAGSDILFVDDRQMWQLAILPYSGWQARIVGGWVMFNGESKYYNGAILTDQTANVPAGTGDAAYVLVELDADLTLTYTKGTEFKWQFPGVDGFSQYVPTGADNTYKWILLVRNGQTEFTYANIWAGQNFRQVNAPPLITVTTASNTSGPGIYAVDTTGGAVTLTLDTDDVIEGRIIRVIDVAGNAGTNAITLATEGAETINGAATLVIQKNYDMAQVYSDGSNWFVFGAGVRGDLYVDSLQFGGGSDEEGTLSWNTDDKTLEIILNGAVLQIGQEIYLYAKNDTASTITDGMLTMWTGVIGASGRVTIAPFVSDSTYPSIYVAGVATQEILAGESGFITTWGVVRQIDTSSWTAGDLLYSDPTSPGDFTNTPPAAPNIKQPYALVTYSDAVNGNMFVRIEGGTSLAENTSDVQIASPAGGDVLAYDGTDLRWENFTPTVEVDSSFTFITAQNQRNLDENLHGGLFELSLANALNSTTPINATIGISKIILVINAGSDFSGSLTFTGTTVNRVTGAETASDTDVIAIDALTTDNSDTDAQGNTRHSFTGAYISSKWFKGSVVISTTDLTLTDVDVYQVSFNQFNDQSNVTLKTFDCSLYANNANAWFYAYLYTLEVTAPKVDLLRTSTVELAVADTAADTAYRLRRGELGKALDGATDGFFLDLFFGPDTLSYWEDITLLVWYSVVYPLTLA